MSSPNLATEQAFRALADALDSLPAEQASDFLARLALILAHELNHAERFDDAVRRAHQPSTQDTTP